MKFFLALFLAVFTTLSSLCGQSFADSLSTFLNSFRTEKVYVGHDKPYYAPGETIWCSVRLVDGTTHQVYDATPLVYVDWIDPEGKVDKTFTLQLKDGFAPLDISTPTTAKTGTYCLRAYSQYQRNFDEAYLFQKEIRLLDFVDAPDSIPTAESFTVKFYPEGGHLVKEMESTVAFKARNNRGENISLRGMLIDASGKKLSDVLTLNEGIGIFKLRPEAGKTYFLRTEYEGVKEDFQLPAALESGFLLHASARSSEAISVTLRADDKNTLIGTTLIAQVRGKIVLQVALEDESVQLLSIPRKEVPSGIIHFTLFDAQQRPVCERLVFNKNPNERVTLGIEKDKEEYKPREEVVLNLSTLLEGQAVLASASITVFDDALNSEEANELTVENYLLLQSDLPGRINNIQQYFAEDNTRTNTLIDLLMLTHGWRKFTWQDALAGQLPDLLFPPEEHLTIAGKITRQEREEGVKADVQLQVLSLDDLTSLEVSTEEDGIFVFKGFDFADTTNVMLQASTHNERVMNKREEGETGRTGSRFVDVRVITPDSLPFNDAIGYQSAIHRPQTLKAYAYEMATSLRENTVDGSEWSVDLETITVTTGRNKAEIREQKIKDRMKEKGVFYFGGTQKFMADDPQFDGYRDASIYELIKTVVPRIHLVPDGGRPRLLYGSITAGVEPLIVVDGSVVPLSVVNNLNPNDVAVIEVLEGLLAQHYSNDDAVVLSLVTKRDGEIEIANPGMLNIVHPGYYQARAFYAPDYYELTDASRPDKRSTLYWNPNVKTADGRARCSFFTGDRTGNYLIRVEGISVDGIPFVGKRLMRVE